MSKAIRTAALVVGVAALAVTGWGLAAGPTLAGAAGSSGIAGLSISTLATALGATAGAACIAAPLQERAA